MAPIQRKRLLVDSKVQGRLVLRVVLYWLACVLTMEFLRLTWLIATGPAQPDFASYFSTYDWEAAGGRLLFASVLLVPIVWDMLNFSNRFAGPVYRMRRVLREVARGGEIEVIKLRKGDYWHGLADDLNAALEHLASESNHPVAKAPALDESTRDMPCCGNSAVELEADDLTPVR